MSAANRAPPPSLATWAWPERGAAGADKAAFLARSHVLKLVAEGVRGVGRRAVLVKGAGLSHLYPEPWMRPMSDIDLLVQGEDLERIVAGLESKGFWREASNRTRTAAALEIPMFAPAPSRAMVELHLSMDKVVQRPIDLGGVFTRASPSEHDGLLLPSLEDQLLFVVLHLGADEFRHATGMVDLEVLLAAGASLEVTARRAREWRGATVLYVALGALHHLLGEKVVPESIVRTLTPSPSRLRLLRTHFNLGQWPVAKRPTRLGLPWIYGQGVMHDDSRSFIAGVANYALNRARERAKTSR